MKKIFSLVLALVMALSLTTMAWAEGTTVDWYGGSDPENAAKLSEYLTNNVVADGTTINLTGAYYDLSLPAGTAVPKNLTIVGGGQNVTPVVNCFIGADIDGLTFNNIWFMAGGGITGNNGGNNNQVIKNMKVEGCFFEGSQAALNLGSSVCENMTIKNCKFIGTPSSNAIRLYNVSGTTTITGNEIAEAPSYGVSLLGTVAGTVNVGDNTIADTTKGALRVDQIQAGAVVSISGNDKIADSALANGQVMKITSVAPDATVTINGIPSGAKTLVEEGNVTLTDGFTSLTMDANKNITGGTFSHDVTNYIPEDYTYDSTTGKVSAIYTVTFDAKGGTMTATQTDVVAGGTVTAPTATKDGFTFDGWYTDEACTSAYDFATPVTADITLYAKWTENTTPPAGDEDGDEGGGAGDGTNTPTIPNWWPVGGTTTTDPDVKSPDTFDAGVALYAAVSVMGAMGAVVLGKKRED